MKKNEIYKEVTDKIIAQLQKGEVPWHKPWSAVGHRSAVRGNVYRGINQLLLSIEAELKGYSDPRWLTYKQAREAGGQVSKGSKSALVVFWKMWKPEAEGDDDDQKSIPIMRYYRVFNVEQCEGLDESKLKAVPTLTDHEPIEAAQKLIEDWSGCPEIAHGDNKAAYAPRLDKIVMPNMNRFDKPESYYGVLLHECIHATGHPSRLGRFDLEAPIAAFASESYAKEELVAEIGSAMLTAYVGIQNRIEASTAYIQNWLTALNDDPKLIVHAAQQAQKASDYIIGAEENK